ncbi:MAG: hypothetical protein JW931_03205 [Methanomicrobiaceae archaeon]|nr:hypothetical protein [Methanomicrobiaceae archaeon]
MTNRVHIKLGPIEFEVEGDIDLIEREREQFFSLLPQAISAVSPVVDKAQIIEASGEIIELDNSHDLSIPLLPENAKSYESIVSFLKGKGFNTDLERVLGVAFYIDQMEGNNYFTSKEIGEKFSEARLSKPKNINDAINRNISKGLMWESDEKKNGLKSFYITNDGIEFCQNYIPSEVKNPKKSAKAQKSRSVKDSELLSIPLDGLHLENYCDISSLEKTNEQILVMIYLYTNEGKGEFFSYNDIVSVLKIKFRISITQRKVRYFFDNAGAKFDKKIENGKAYYKIMASGIKEAQKIIADQQEKNLDC